MSYVRDHKQSFQLKTAAESGTTEDDHKGVSLMPPTMQLKGGEEKEVTTEKTDEPIIAEVTQQKTVNPSGEVNQEKEENDETVEQGALDNHLFSAAPMLPGDPPESGANANDLKGETLQKKADPSKESADNNADQVTQQQSEDNQEAGPNGEQEEEGEGEGWISKLLSWGGRWAIKGFKLLCKTVGIDAGKIINFIKQAGGVLADILAKPIAFVKNLINSIKTGLKQFMGNAKQNIFQSAISWLMSQSGELGIQIPQQFDMKGIFSLATQALGLTWNNIRAKLVKVVGEERMEKAEQTVGFIQDFMEGGMSALWEKAKDFIGDLKSMFVEEVKSWAITQLIQKGITKLASFFIPGAGLISAIQSLYKAVQFLMDNGQR